MRHTMRALSLWALAALTLGVVACDDSIEGTSFPEIQATPNRVVLTPVPIGQQTSSVVALRNVGGSELIITEIAFTNATNDLEFSKNHAALPIRLGADEIAELTVTFTPRDSVLGEGGVYVRSNDRDTPELLIPITTTNAQTGLTVEPAALQLVAEAVGSPVEGSVTLTNIGLVPVTVLDVFLTEETPRDFEPAEDTAARPTLNQDQSAQFTVRYTPRDATPDRGTLVLLTDDPQYPRIEVPLTGLLPRPAIQVEPGQVNFGAVDQGSETEPTVLTVTNVGSAPLTLERIEFAFAAPPINDQYRLVDLPELPVTLAPDSGDFVQVGVVYAPQVDGRHRTAISFVSNDPVSGIYTVPVDGRVRRPCISVRPAEVSFGRVALGQESARQQLQVANCGDMPLEISAIAIDNMQFSWANEGGGQQAAQVIDPLSAVNLEVWYANAGLAQGDLDEGTLTISNNTPDNPELAVPLSVVGGGAPTCDLIVLPNRVDFGLVSRGSNRTRTLQVVNRGTGECQIRTEVIAPVIPIPGIPPVFFLTRPAGARRAAPGEFIDFDVTYSPRFFSADAATYTVTYFDPFQNLEKMATATVQGVSGESNIEVIPSRLDFGAVTAGECASRDERITVYNTGIVDLCIRDVNFEGACDEFFLVERPRADADGCIIVSRNQPADFIFNYEPGALGEDECEVIFVSDAADNPNLRVPLRGEGVADSRQTDEFVQTSGRTVDVLFVVDNSGCMGEGQRNLRDNFADFIGGAQQFQNDYQ
ncbi:MAG: choice-of-anchor D domain-containing protein, partial [Myxococcales bacterium]|nr:choice-of-anchor D domain-containing protein [Myxococcales bacterium]